MKPRAKKSGRYGRYSPNRPHWAALEDMPPLSHYPNRDVPFDFANSDVVWFIIDTCGVDMEFAIRIYESARAKGVIKFDPETRLWSGVKGGSQ